MKFAPWLAAAALAVLLQGCTAVKTVIRNFADLDDHRIFDNRVVATVAQPSMLRRLSHEPAWLHTLRVPDAKGKARPLHDYLDRTRTAAFVVLRDDRIVYERYARGFQEASRLNSFSIAKSMLATLVGIAIADGRIASLDATVAQYRPDFAGTAYGPIRLRSLLAMTSGVGDAPSLLPGSAQYYYGDDLAGVVADGVREAPQGERWRYSEADAQMLGFVLAAAIGTDLSSYLEKKLWKPLGMESDALWALDREGGMEKAFCCVSARARDFARFGKLFLDAGVVDGVRIVPREWADPATFPGWRTADGYTHRHLWWFPPGGEGDFYAYGHNGQYVYVNPASRTVIVKFSEGCGEDPVGMFRAVAAALKPAERSAEMDRLLASTGE